MGKEDHQQARPHLVLPGWYEERREAVACYFEIRGIRQGWIAAGVGSGRTYINRVLNGTVMSTPMLERLEWLRAEIDAGSVHLPQAPPVP